MKTDTYRVTIATEDISGLSPREVQEALLGAYITKAGWSVTTKAMDDGDLTITVERERER